jgi:nitroreductase
MKILDAIESRRAKRMLSDKKIEETALKRVMQAAHLAPSCFNNQPWRFMLASEGESLEVLRSALTKGNIWALTAPTLIAVGTRYEEDCQLPEQRDYALFDTGLAVGNLLTQATAEGLIAHPMAGFDPKKVKEAFHLDDDFVLITVIALAYPGEASELNEAQKKLEHGERVRVELESVVSFNGSPKVFAKKENS